MSECGTGNSIVFSLEKEAEEGANLLKFDESKSIAYGRIAPFILNLGSRYMSLVSPRPRPH
jgi:hypothetical protein